MKFSVPFVPDPLYAAFLADVADTLASLYFSLAPGPVLDARIRIRASGPEQSSGPAGLADLLRPLQNVDKYVLANTRFVSPAVYTDQDALTRFLDRIARLHDAVGIRGLVITDAYLVNALDRTGHPVIPDLEAIPGVNSMIDSREKLAAILDVFDQTRFKPPGRLIPDRSLNRDIPGLTSLVRDARHRLPGCRIELLANEGCISHCPFKPAHDAHIALSNTGLVSEATWMLNRYSGCHHYLLSRPHRFLKSPFIRPEDVHHYTGIADGIKLCGRTLGTGFLERAVRAYHAGTFGGNLFEIMDAAGFMADHFHLNNTALGPEFFKSLTTCTNECKHCRICHTLFKKAARKKESRFKKYKDIS